MSLVNLLKTKEYLEELVATVRNVPEHRKEFNAHLLRSELGKRGSDQPFPVSMGTFFINLEEYEKLLDKTRILIQAILKIRKEYLAGNPDIRAILQLSSAEEELLAYETPRPDQFGAIRFDYFPTAEGIKLCELNSDNPDVILVGDQVSRSLYEEMLLPNWKEMIVAPKASAEVLLDSIKANVGSLETLGVIGPLDRWIIGENHKTIEAMGKLGVEVIEGNLDDVTYSDGTSAINGSPITAARRVAELKYFIKNISSINGLLRSLKEDKLKLYNQLHDRLLGHKSVFAILTNEEYAHFFTEEEQQVINELVPWTRVVSSFEDEYVANKDTLVLKPSGGSEAEGIFIGQVTSAEDWKISLRKAVSEQGNWIIQKAISVQPIPIVVDVEEQLQIQDMNADLSVHMFYNENGGGDGLLFSRYAPGAVNNIIAGGGLLFPYVLAA